MKESVVTLQEKESGIVIVTMQDRIHKNTFSDELTRGLVDAFNAIKENSAYKVIILTGYDTYFASGGTKEGLLSIHEGKTSFSDNNLYSLPLECKIPVIAAMQGHGIGGGFALGMYADFVIMSKESIYTANFMQYGFTPGMGSTYIIPKKLGICLAEELLIGAGKYRGAELEKRGIPFPVLPRAEVLDYALRLARQIAEKPLISLVTLKNHLVSSLREKLPKIIERELIMHEKTFHQVEVRDRITTLFGK